mgnify:CR=1 FL=1
MIAHHHSQLRADTFFYENMQEIAARDRFFTKLEELKRRIKEVVDALPPIYREAFVMHRFKNKSYKEIAEFLQYPPNGRLPDPTGTETITDHVERLFAADHGCCSLKIFCRND